MKYSVNRLPGPDPAAKPLFEPYRAPLRRWLADRETSDRLTAHEPPPAYAAGLSAVLKTPGENFSQMLLRMIEERGLVSTDVYKKAQVDRKIFSRIRTAENYRPSKATAILFALALELSLAETKDLLARAGYALSPGSRSDLVICFFIEQGCYSVSVIDTALYEYSLPTLLSYGT